MKQGSRGRAAAAGACALLVGALLVLAVFHSAGQAGALDQWSEGPAPAYLVPAPAAADAMVAVIEAAFADVHGGGGYLEANQNTDGTYAGVGNQQANICAELNYSYPLSTIFERDPSAREQMQQLGIVRYCDPETGEAKDDPTCLALRATREAFLTLAGQFPQGPANLANFIFARPVPPGTQQNAKDGSPAWTGALDEAWAPGSVAFTPQAVVDGVITPPDAAVLDANGVLGFALCDITRTVLTQSNSQGQEQTCGPSAILDALSLRAPAEALRLSTQLLWTGTLPGGLLEAAPCAYTRASFPGLTATLYTPAGAEHMWTQALMSSHDAAVLGSCDEPSQHILSPYNVTVSRDAFSESQIKTIPNFVMGWCERLLAPVLAPGGRCSYVQNNSFACGGYLDDEDCVQLVAGVGAGLTLVDFARAVLAGPGVITDAPFLAAHPRVNAWIEQSLAIIARGSFESEQQAFALVNTRGGVPSATVANVRAACSGVVAIARVAMGMLYSLDATQTCTNCACDHWIVLESCDEEKDEYVFWSWGYRVKPVKLAWVQATVCGFVIAEPAGPALPNATQH